MTEKRFALVIASYKYEDPDLRQLVAPAQDAESLTRVLADPAIGGFEVQPPLLNEKSYKVSQEIEAFFSDRKRNELLLLYFSGHGIKDEGGQLYFATLDTRRKLLRSTAVPANFVNEVMRRSRSRRQVLLLDCCYSGAFARGMVVRADKAIGTGEYFKEGRGQVVLTASDAMQYSFEGDKVKGEGVRSIFTHTLVRGLETGEADMDKDGYISFDDMYGYISDRVTDEMPQQEPRKWAFNVQGEIIIARNPKPVLKPLSSELQQAIENSLPRVREGAVHELARLLRGSDKGLALAAREALKRLSDDDSRRVSSAAAKCLAPYTEAQREKGLVYDEKGMYDKLIAKWKNAIEINPPYAGAHNNLGVVYGEKGMCDEAIAECKKAIEINPNYAEAHHSLAVGYYSKGKHSLAIKHCDIAIELGGKVLPKLLKDLEPHRKR